MNYNRGVAIVSFLFLALFLTLLPAYAQTTMFADVLKGHQLGDWTVDFGGEERLRWEYRSNFDLNDLVDDDGSIFYNRVRLNVMAKYLDEYEVFVEGLQADVWTYEFPNPRTLTSAQRDAFDLHQAYIKMKDPLGCGIGIKVGRQEITLGKGRLIACPTWANRINAFDAVLLTGSSGPFSASVFGGSLVNYDQDNPNHSSDESFLAGIYAGYQEDKYAPKFEPYFISQLVNTKGLRQALSSHTHRHTVGLRTVFTLWELVFDVEVPYQFGETGATEKDISAYGIHADVTKTFADVPMKPVAKLEFNLASGDNDPSDDTVKTFIPPSQSTHGPYGLADLIRWQNMREIAMNVAFQVADGLTLTPGANFLWLDNTHDAWYNVAGVAQNRAHNGSQSSYFGSELSIVAAYQLTKVTQLEAGYAHFFAGTFLKETGAHDDVDWIYSQLNTRF
ncbi:MAG: alginate export family protein [Deltaproteobacteria bacterium]